MNSFELPTLAAGISILIGFLSTFAIAFVNGVLPFVKKAWHKRVVTVVVSLALGGAAMLLYYAMTREPLPEWPVLVILSLLAASASYALVTKGAADRIERSASGSPSARDNL